ncbi:hypothetical protein V8F06_007139 [Rhypophila decipiens]
MCALAIGRKWCRHSKLRLVCAAQSLWLLTSISAVALRPELADCHFADVIVRISYGDLPWRELGRSRGRRGGCCQGVRIGNLCRIAPIVNINRDNLIAFFETEGSALQGQRPKPQDRGSCGTVGVSWVSAGVRNAAKCRIWGTEIQRGNLGMKAKQQPKLCSISIQSLDLDLDLHLRPKICLLWLTALTLKSIITAMPPSITLPAIFSLTLALDSMTLLTSGMNLRETLLPTIHQRNCHQKPENDIDIEIHGEKRMNQTTWRDMILDSDLPIVSRPAAGHNSKAVIKPYDRGLPHPT